MRTTLPALKSTVQHSDGSIEGVNLSQLLDWQRCRYRWHLGYRRHIRRRALHRPMELGSAGHAGMQAGFRQFARFDPPGYTDERAAQMTRAIRTGIGLWARAWLDERPGQVTDEEQDALQTVMQEASQIVHRTFTALDLDRWEVLWMRDGSKPWVEEKLSIPFLPDIPFYGTEDVVLRDRCDGGTWVADYKFREKFHSPEQEEVDLQLPVYQHMLAQHGVLTTGALKIQIRSAVPLQPKVNKDSSLSRARIATDWPTYERAVLAAGLDPADYREEMEPKLDVEFLRVTPLYRNQFYVQRIWDDIITPLGKLWAKSKSPVRSMHFMNCTGCWAKDFCLAELKGEDPDFLLQTQYVDQRQPQERLILRPEDIEVTA